MTKDPGKTGSCLISVCVAGVVLFCVPAIAAERTPPPVLDKMPAELRQVEDFFRKGKWKESLDQLGGIEDSFQNVILPLEKAVGIAGMDEVSFALDDLRAGLSVRDGARTEGAFLRFEKKFLDLCEKFDFQIPPVIQLLQMDFEAAERSRKENDFSLAVKNLADAYELLPWIEDVLQRVGVEGARLRFFRGYVRGAKEAAERGDQPALAEQLQKGLEFLPDFIFRCLKAATPGNGKPSS